MTASDPEIGKSIVANGIVTNYLDTGEGEPVLLLHGSGPGVTAYANWRLVLPDLARRFRVIAPDIVGFGYTARPKSATYSLEYWLAHLVGLVGALKLERVSVIGNSFGGALALAIATRYPKLVKRLVLMGSVGVNFEITPGLDAVWGYQPSPENMSKLLHLFAYNRNIITPDLIESRYRASTRPGFQDSFERMFPAPRQRGISDLTSPEGDIAKIEQPTLLIHGKDDQVIPLETSLKLNALISGSQLHVFSKCGHWVQIEQSRGFCFLVRSFLEGLFD